MNSDCEISSPGSLRTSRTGFEKQATSVDRADRLHLHCSSAVLKD